jgi:ADP-heptose:LPS heptosyltransferase
VNILLIRLRLIGDVVFTTPVIRALRRQYPQARLAYVVEPHAAAVVTGNPHLDELIVASAPDAPRRLLRDLALARRIRSNRYDLVIDLHGGPRSALLAWLSGASRRIGYEITGRGWMYTDRVARSRRLPHPSGVVRRKHRRPEIRDARNHPAPCQSLHAGSGAVTQPWTDPVASRSGVIQSNGNSRFGT